MTIIFNFAEIVLTVLIYQLSWISRYYWYDLNPLNENCCSSLLFIVLQFLHNPKTTLSFNCRKLILFLPFILMILLVYCLQVSPVSHYWDQFDFFLNFPPLAVSFVWSIWLYPNLSLRECFPIPLFCTIVLIWTFLIFWKFWSDLYPAFLSADVPFKTL